MKFALVLAAGATLAFAQTPPDHDAAPSAASEPANAPETPAQRDARLRWWREARFGMFIHWGLYAVPAGSYRGREIVGTRGLLNGAEWIMNYGKIPVAEYAGLAQEFNPTRFNAAEWVALAKAAGMRYIVITAKHHDGFALYRSRASTFNICEATPFARDPLAELAAACRREGIKLGFYYSQAQDWHHAGGEAEGGHWDPAQEGSMDDYLEKIAVPQVRELLSNYGDVAVLWWDTPQGMTPERARRFLPLLKLQPALITNNRLGGRIAGDIGTPEQRVPADGLPGRDWETCMTINNTWGYRRSDQNWKSPERLVRTLVDIASKGGNFLLNVGPTADGEIPAPSVERLRAMGAWLEKNGEAIYATTASPFKQLAWGRATQKPGRLFLHVFDWPASGTLTVPMRSGATAAHLLAAPDRPLALEPSAAGLRIRLPATPPDPVATVIVLEGVGQVVPLPPPAPAPPAR